MKGGAKPTLGYPSRTAAKIDRRAVLRFLEELKTEIEVPLKDTQP